MNHFRTQENQLGAMGGNVPTPMRSTLLDSLEGLEGAAQNLHGELNSLSQCLSPVLVPEQPSEMLKNPEVGGGSPVQSRLEALTRHLRLLITDVVELRRRLDL